jgi:hypothetical protein
MGVSGNGDPSRDPVLVREPHDGDDRGALPGPLRPGLFHPKGGTADVMTPLRNMSDMYLHQIWRVRCCFFAT